MRQLLTKYGWFNAFLILSGCIMLHERYLFEERSVRLAIADWYFPVSWFPSLVATPESYLLVVDALTIGCFALALIPSRLVAFPATIFWMTFLALLNSFGHVQNSKHGYFMAALGAAIAVAARMPKRTFDFALAAVASIYVPAGLWKLFALLRKDDVLDAAAHMLPNAIAYCLAEHYEPAHKFYLQFFQDHYYVSAATWFTVIGLEVLAPFAMVFFPWTSIPLLMSLIVFHYGAKLIVGPDFQIQVVMLVFLIAVLSFRGFQSFRKHAFMGARD